MRPVRNNMIPVGHRREQVAKMVADQARARPNWAAVSRVIAVASTAVVITVQPASRYRRAPARADRKKGRAPGPGGTERGGGGAGARCRVDGGRDHGAAGLAVPAGDD